MPTLAIAGRPNVGKSTLFNRLTGKRHAIVHDAAGTTRDWREGEAKLGPLRFTVLDTAGWEQAKKGSLQARMVEQSAKAIDQADALLLVIDGREGITATDQAIARTLRKSGKPIALAVNKTEGKPVHGLREEAQALGFGDPAFISAEHNEGMAELYEVIEKVFAGGGTSHEARGADEKPSPSGRGRGEGRASKKDSQMEENPHPGPLPEGEGEMVLRSSPLAPIQIAFIGQPNAGKSTLLNQILGEERVLTGPESGITRDSIAVDFTYGGHSLKLVDTAGMRKKSRVQATLEGMAVGDSLRTIQFAQVVVVLMDAACPLERQDLNIVSLVEREGRAVVIALNKWDEVKDQEAYLKIFHYEVARLLPQVKNLPIVPLSALKGTGVNKLMNAVFAAYAGWNRKIATSPLNRWLGEALFTHQPPLIKGRRIKFRYVTQTKIRPPTFQIFSNLGEKDVPESYLRYLVNSMREAFDLPGVPIRLILKKSKNPYAE